MSKNQIFKAIYHFSAAILILFIAFFIKQIPRIAKALLVIVSFSHLYDTWWFCLNDGYAPI